MCAEVQREMRQRSGLIVKIETDENVSDLIVKIETDENASGGFSYLEKDVPLNGKRCRHRQI